MNNKSSRHKTDNTFKFQTFSERIAQIDINVFYKIGHENESQFQENECFFHQAVQNWNMLNLTESYEVFKKEIRAQTLITLPQLILDKNRVVEVLLKHIRLKNPLSLQPLLDLVVALAKDLRRDFYPYFNEFLEILIGLLSTKNTEQLEWTFTCLAYLFKFLSTTIIRDLKCVFNSLLPLLSNNKPDYIKNFAAESFSYVARKVKDKKTFLEIISKSVRKHKDGVEGCGRLFFEIIHGVSRQFHSCAEDFLRFLFDSLSDPKLPHLILFEILECTVSNIVSNIHPQKSQIFWNVLINSLEISNNRKTTELLLKLLGQAVEFKGGKFLTDNKSVVETVKKIFDSNLGDEVILINTQVSIILLKNVNNKLTQEQASGLIRKLLNLGNKEILLYFFDNVNDCFSFEPLILPHFLKFCALNNLDDDCFKVLTKLLLKKSPFVESGSNLGSWVKYPLDFRDNFVKINGVLLENLDYKNFDKYLSTLICVPHLTNWDNTEIIYNNLNKIIEEIDGGNCLNKMLFLLNYTVECLIHLNENFDVKFDMILNAILPFSNNENYLSSLKTLNLLITNFNNNDKIISKGNLGKLDEVLRVNFNSPYHEMRLLTSHLYSLFENLPEFDLRHSTNPEVRQEAFKVFSLCHEVEKIDPQVQTYREQIKILDKFNFDKPQMLMCSQTEFKTIPLRYLCGCLFVNFKLLWEPTIKVISSHASGLKVNEFWEIFGCEIKNSVESARFGRTANVHVIETKWDFLGDLFQNSQQFSVKPDFGNYRLLLWRALELFPQIAEAKTRDVSEIFLDFISTEFTKNNSDVATSLNIKQNDSQPTDLEKTENIEENKPKKTTNQLLLYCLKVFSKVQSPKSMYREPELYKLYLDLLQHKKSEIQTAAFNCILTYKHKFLTPYKENICNLIDDKNFKNEITTFRIDKDSEIQKDHRPDLIPIILRIVFSKMTAKIGLRTGGKSSGQLRRNLVLRFLAGCEENEIMNFLQMTFKIYENFFENDLVVMVEKISDKIDLEKFHHPKRLLSTVNLLDVILEQFGGLMGDEIIDYLLKVILIIGANLRGAFKQMNAIHGGYSNILRTIKNNCLKILEKLFSQFDSHNWTEQQINAIFYAFIWPYLNKLNIEGIHSPTALLKLIKQWGSNPRYFLLLVKQEGDEIILKNVIDLLINNKSSPIVVSTIWEIVEKLLTLINEEENNEKLNFGSRILMPFIPQILQKLKGKLQTRTKNLSQRELFILSRISELVTEPQSSDEVLKLLLPLILRKTYRAISEDVINQYLTTIENLLKNVGEPLSHFRLIAPLFGEINYCSSRKLLLKILDNLSTNFAIIKELNAFDAKWLDQPDFERRHEAFKQIQNEMEAFDFETGVLILYNSFHFLKNEKDLSLKENSAHALKTISVKLLQSQLSDQEFVIELLLETIRRGLKSKDEFRNECISLLGHLARECPQSHPVLRDLNRYTNKTDLEVDFFENLTHLQKHRHARALLKFCQITKELTTNLNTRTLTQFLLPLTSFYLRNEQYLGKNTLVDASIESIGTVCRILPWHQYEGVLKFYLSKLRWNIDYQKQLVRVVVAVLDAFHFDTSKAEIAARYEKDSKQIFNKTDAVEVDSNGVLNKESEVKTTKEVLEKQEIQKDSKDSNELPNRKDPSALLDNKDLKAKQSNELLEKQDLEDFEKEQNTNEKDSNANEVKDSEEVPEEQDLKELSKGQAMEQNSNGQDYEALDSNELSEDQLDMENDSNELSNDKESKELSDEIDKNELAKDQDADDLLEEQDLNDELDFEQNFQEEEELESSDAQNVKVFDKTTILCKSTATRIRQTIQIVLLPQLHKALAEFTAHELSHKLNKKRTLMEREEEDLSRVPLSLALVKLLQKLPKEILEANLPGIFLKLCSFLKSHLESVRKITRETLQKIMQTLGPDYLHLLLSEMTTCLNRGYQVHVLVFTVHAILHCLEDLYQPGDMDKNLLTILKLCKTDLFGAVSEEKEIGKIISKTSEAKSTKSFSTFQIISKFITEKCLMDLIEPVREVLELSRNFKIVLKAEECFKCITLGLVENRFISLENLLKFAYGSFSETIPQLTKVNKNIESQKEIKITDCFIIQPAPVGRSGVRQNSVKFSNTTNAHVLIEFGLRLCLALLKDERIRNDDYKAYLDPFVIILKNSLNSKHVKLTTLTLKCLTHLMRHDLPAMRVHIEEITRTIFDILHKFAAPGLRKGDNFELALAAFKTISILVKDVKYHTITTEQLKILLLYVEQDMYDHDRQAATFNLLKSIISRKLVVHEMYQVMKKIAELCVTSELDHVRHQSRVVFHQFFMEYPLGKQLSKYLAFFIAQLDYELRFGRESAIEMLQTIISTIPLKLLREESGTFLIGLSARLVNDEEPECRKKVANCLTILFERLRKNDHDQLFDVMIAWFNDKNAATRQLGAQVCGLLVQVEKSGFETRFPKLIPKILKQFGLSDKPGRFVRLQKESDDQAEQRLKDHHLYQTLQMVLKLCSLCPAFLKLKEIETLSYHIQTLLEYPHDWVRLAAAQFLGFVLSTLDKEKLINLLTEKNCGDSGYLFIDPENHVKSLALDLCDQLQPGIKADLAEQVIKNLLFIARIYQKLRGKFLWLTKRMRKIVNTEIVENPGSTVLRTEVFKWIAGVATIVDVENIRPVLNTLLAPLVREMVTTEESNAPLRHLAKDVGGLLKNRIGVDVYTQELLKLQQNLTLKRADRKRSKNQMAVTNPELHAKKKIKRNEKKKLVKKRKIEDLRGKKSFKRRKTVDLDNEEIM